MNITLRGVTYTPDTFDALVLNTMHDGLTNATCLAYALQVQRSRIARTNIAASLERLTAAGRVERVDFAVTDLSGAPLAAPAYRRLA